MKGNKRYLLYIFLILDLAIIFAGDFNYKSYKDLLTLPVSNFILYFFINYKKLEKPKSIQNFGYSFMLGMTLSIFDFSPFTLKKYKSIFGIYFPYSNIIGYWIAISSILILVMLFRKSEKTSYESQFSSNISLERDKKINKII
jgi:hypothetical protein